MKKRFHVLGLAHQPVTKKITSCAYTAKVLNMCVMLKKAGHEVFLYHAGSFVQKGIADQCIQVVDDDTMSARYGSKFYETYNQTWDQNDMAWIEFRRKAGLTISKNLSDAGDIVLASYGTAHQPCCPSPSAALTIEMGIGYEGVFADCKIWESYAWRHYVYGRYPDLKKDRDVVIPGYFDPKDFTFRDRDQKEGYFLCLGRVIPEKGIVEACQAAKEVGVPIKIAGPGDKKWIEENCPNAEYLGSVNGNKRAELLSKANGLICYTKYVEPFGNVAIEAMFSGTPVISSDWGAFTETVINRQTGFRCSDIQSICGAIEMVRDWSGITPTECTSIAKNFAIENIWPRYEDYFSYQHHLFCLENGYAV